jgi:hypothetical protein
MQLLLTLFLPFLAAASSTSDRGSVIVRVVDPDRQVLPGTTVSLLRAGDCPEKAESSAVSDARGEARLQVRERRRYSIRFELQGLLGGTIGPMSLSPDAPFHVTARMYTVWWGDFGIRGEVPAVDITKVPK